MKKGFTLSEVLITIVIIGIISAITVPSITNSIENNQYKTALKKNFSVISNAFNLAYGFNYDDFRDWEYVHSATFTQEVAGKLFNYLHVIKKCKNKETGCFARPKGKNGEYALWSTEYGISGGEFYGFVLNDGTSVSLDIANKSNTNKVGVIKNLITDEANLFIYVDVNGMKKPNVLGKDVFLFVLTEKGIVPGGTDNNSLYCNNKSVNYNYDCAAMILRD